MATQSVVSVALRVKYVWAAMPVWVALLCVLTGAPAAKAQYRTGVLTGPGGSVAVGKFRVTTQHCPDFPPSDISSPTYLEDLIIYSDCKAAERFMNKGFNGLGFLPEPGPVGGNARLPFYLLRPNRAENAKSVTFDATSAAADLPFLGNWLATVAYLPNDPNPANATKAYGVSLRRETDCSLTEDILDTTGSNTPASWEVQTVPALQDYFHKLAGLTTTADVFAGGCQWNFLGAPSIGDFLLLGPTASGAAVSVSLTNNGQLYSEVTDITANTFTNHLLLSNVNGAIAAADLNGDGIIDVVATFVTDPNTQQLSTAVLLGNGDGTFQAATYYDVPGDVTVDDVTGDGKPDIVVLTNPGITTLIGKGDGTFTVSAVSASSRTIFGGAASQVVSGDFNGDGKKDVLANGVVYLGNGDGTFTAGSAVSTNSTLNYGASSGQIAVGSLRNNGKLDVVLSQEGFVVIFYGKGDGTFTQGPTYASLPDFLQVTLTDIDGDGNLDIFLGSGTDGIYGAGGVDIEPSIYQILMNRGDGTFVDSLAYEQGRFAQGAGGSPQTLVSADFTGDGKADVLVTSPGTLLMLPGDGAGNLGAAVSSNLNMSPAVILVRDMNGDGKPDLVIAGSGGAGSLVSVLINQGNGTFGQETDYTVANSPVSLALGDFNGDGFIDAAVGVGTYASSGTSGVFVLPGKADGTFGSPVQIDNSAYPAGLTAGDLNGDGRADLVVADEGVFDPGGSQQVNGALHVYLGNADGSFTAAAKQPTTTATNYSIAGLVDLDKDGKLDLVVAGNIPNVQGSGLSAPNLFTLKGNGDGTFQTATAYQLAGQDGIGATTMAFLDVNHDGNPDVLLGNPNDYTELWIGKGDGTLLGGALALGQRPITVAAADLNGDNLPELLVGATSSSSGGVLDVFANMNVWTAATVGTTASQVTLSSSANPSTVGASVTFTATVAPTSGMGTPTGSVTFLDNGSSIGTGTLNGSGVATFATLFVSAGTYAITAQYGGDATFAGSTSAALTQTVNAGGPASFTMSAASPATVSVAAGKSAGPVTFTLTPVNGSTQTVTLACSGLPAKAACAFTPASVTLDGVHPSAAISLSITTTASTMATPGDRGRRGPWWFVWLSAATVVLVIAWMVMALRSMRVARLRLVRVGALACFAVAVICGAAACGGGSSSSGGSGGGGGGTTGTPTGSYTVTITGTGSPGNTTATTTVALTVTD